MTAAVQPLTQPRTRAERLSDLALRCADHAHTSPDPVLAGLVAEIAAELRLLAHTTNPED